MKSEFIQVRNKIKSLLDSKVVASKNFNKFIKSGTCNFNTMSGTPDEQIFKLRKRSFDLLFKMCKATGFRELDLHYMTLEESKTIVDILLDHIESEMRTKNHYM